MQESMAQKAQELRQLILVLARDRVLGRTTLKPFGFLLALDTMDKVNSLESSMTCGNTTSPMIFGLG
jgi:hypothetical protein